MEKMAGMCNLPITSRLRYHCATRAPPLKALPQKLLSVNIIRMRNRKVKVASTNCTIERTFTQHLAQDIEHTIVKILEKK